MTQDVFAANVVPALLDQTPFDQVYLATKQGLQFAGHLQLVMKPPAGVWLKGDQHIYIAVGAEVLAQR
jgi:hypothetical protein